MEIFQMGKDHYVDIMEVEERRPMIDIIVEWEKQGHINSGHRVFDLTVTERNMGERKTCSCSSHLQFQEVAQKCLLASEFLTWILVNKGLEGSELLKGRQLILLKRSPIYAWRCGYSQAPWAAAGESMPTCGQCQGSFLSTCILFCVDPVLGGDGTGQMQHKLQALKLMLCLITLKQQDA